MQVERGPERWGGGDTAGTGGISPLLITAGEEGEAEPTRQHEEVWREAGWGGQAGEAGGLPADAAERPGKGPRPPGSGSQRESCERDQFWGFNQLGPPLWPD